MFFQRHCVADTTAEYTPLPDGAISVHNRCRTDSGFDDATGKATVVEDAGQPKPQVPLAAVTHPAVAPLPC